MSAEEKQTEQTLKFDTLLSQIDVTFWQQFGRKKIDDYKLSEEAVPIFGSFTGGIHRSNVVLRPTVFVNGESLKEPQSIALTPFHFKIPGQLLNTNKIESFKQLDKKQLLREQAMQIVSDIASKACIKNPSLLYRFFIISFADLKKHRYIYWCCFPAIVPKHFKVVQHSHTKWSEYGTDAQRRLLCTNFYKFCGDHAMEQSLLFIVDKQFKIHTLSSCEDGVLASADIAMFGYIDNGNLADAPSWFLRNILLFIAVTFKRCNTDVCVLAVRRLIDDLADSVVFNLGVRVDDATVSTADALLNVDNIRCVGWERNGDQQLLPKKANLSQMLDPIALSAESVDLNLKLMRWRRLPQIDLALIKQQKFLLCGAGTLGTYVSRVLLAWGCSHITFVDNGKVSYSNPVRQCLFKYTDCIETDGGPPNFKAEIAAKAIADIFPSAVCKGHVLSIAMPGHFVDKSVEAQQKSEFETFDALVQAHDVVFLLTDSRESRWLPTVAAKAHDKIVVNIALGFDSYLVMRHSQHGDGLGCYFCSDVVVPIDSITDRALDQQCTVTRPGLAPLAAGLGVEFLVSYLQRMNTDKLSKEVPHQVRGSLFDYKNVCIAPTAAYDRCSACSAKIIDEYKEKRWAFVSRVCNEPKYLEQVSGLDQLKELDDIDIDWDDEVDGDDDENDL